MTDTSRPRTLIVSRHPTEEKYFQVRFRDPLTETWDPVSLVIHTVALQKLFALGAGLLAGKTESAGVEGVYIEERA